jgi:hypothetical protein
MSSAAARLLLHTLAWAHPACGQTQARGLHLYPSKGMRPQLTPLQGSDPGPIHKHHKRGLHDAPTAPPNFAHSTIAKAARCGASRCSVRTACAACCMLRRQSRSTWHTRPAATMAVINNSTATWPHSDPCAAATSSAWVRAEHCYSTHVELLAAARDHGATTLHQDDDPVPKLWANRGRRSSSHA